ncbi:MAG: flavodoxin family protein [Thermoleophilaceae bacterium]|nr:flavodoxin family protein [Thermoleophilaceae bacterium]
MSALVVYESIYGNTRAVAEAVAEGLGGADVREVTELGELAEAPGLIVAGGPTHMHGLTTGRSRRMAHEAAKEDGAETERPEADRGLRECLRDLPDGGGALAAAFDTRLDRAAALTGSAARGIARRLKRRGYAVVATDSFLVEDAEGPLEEGELERARAWGAGLAERQPAGG